MRYRFRSLLITLVGLSACGKPPPDRTAEVGLGTWEDPKPAVARIIGMESLSDGGQLFIVDASSGPRQCEFSISVWTEGRPAQSPFSTAEVELAARSTPDCTTFLRDLAKAMLYSGDIPPALPIDRITAPAAVIGEKQSRATGGGFQSPPDGPWTLIKVFLTEDGGEFFLNIDSSDRVMEFALKDEDFASDVISSFASLLSSRA